MTDSQTDQRLSAPAAERNAAPILEVLQGVLPARGTVLEIASGTGQHAAYFAAHFATHFAATQPDLLWQPSDADPRARASIAAWRAHTGLANLLAPLDLDVMREPWPIAAADAIVCINMIHIAPWEAALALMQGAGTRLATSGVLVTYGPYRRGGAHTAPSNAAFDADLRARNPAWGVRDMEAVETLAEAAGLVCEARVPMPANNFSLVFRKR
jgi:SAM-dependent methyltransferase